MNNDAIFAVDWLQEALAVFVSYEEYYCQSHFRPMT